MPADLRVKDALAALFQANASDSQALYGNITRTLDLIDKTRAKISADPTISNIDPLIATLNEAYSAFSSIAMTDKWSKLTTALQAGNTPLTERILTISDMLEGRVRDRPVSRDEVALFLKRIEQLRIHVSKSELPSVFTRFLAEQLEKMRRALLHYEYFGPDILASELHEVAAATVLNRPLQAQQIWESPVVVEYRKLLSDAANISDVIQSVPLLNEAITFIVGKLLS